jgi:hypothetical protein
MPLRKLTFMPAFALTSGLACAAAGPARAASGEFADTAAMVIAVFVITVVPIGLIVLFWLVHVMPEKIAERRHHPQKEAIHVLCLLSLVFGGLLWPLAWLWAYSNPVLHQLGYGRDKHDEYFDREDSEPPSPVQPATLQEELRRLRHDVDVLEKRGGSSGETQEIRDRLASLESRLGPNTTSGAGV